MTEITQSILNKIYDGNSTQNLMQIRLNLLDYVISLSMCKFRWIIPDDIITNDFTIEKSLITNGVIAGVSNAYGKYILPCTTENLNIINNPIQIRIPDYGMNDEILNEIIGKSFYHDEFVVGYDSIQRNSTIGYINMLIDDMANTIFSMSEIFNKMRQPYVVTTNDKKILNDKFLMNDIATKKVIFTDDIKSINVLKLDLQPEYIDKLQMHLDDLMRKLHGTMGITYNVDPKKERMLNAEISSNTEIEEIFSKSKLLARQNFCDAFNKKFGSNLQVYATIGEKMEGNYEKNMC